MFVDAYLFGVGFIHSLYNTYNTTIIGDALYQLTSNCCMPRMGQHCPAVCTCVCRGSSHMLVPFLLRAYCCLPLHGRVVIFIGELSSSYVYCMCVCMMVMCNFLSNTYNNTITGRRTINTIVSVLCSV
jgi:hypothetical protein